MVDTQEYKPYHENKVKILIPMHDMNGFKDPNCTFVVHRVQLFLLMLSYIQKAGSTISSDDNTLD